MKKGKYVIEQDLTNWENPSGLWVVINTETLVRVAEFDFKLEAKEYVKELKKIDKSLESSK